MISSDDLERILRRITEHFSDAELAVFAVLATAVKRNASPGDVRRQVAAVVRELQTKTRGDLRAALVAASDLGLAKAKLQAEEVGVRGQHQVDIQAAE